MALGIEGVRVGTWQSPRQVSGCTVILPPPDTLGAVAVRGSAPGTREALALGANGHVQVCHGVVLSGSSAYGLAVADGVMRWLEERGTGYQVGPGLVPIVGGAILLDGGVLEPDERPGADEGRLACDQATEDDPEEGAVGAGTGASIAKVAGIEHGWRGGQGLAVRSAAGITVGAIVANNAVGELIDDDGTWIARARVDETTPRYPEVGLDRHRATDGEPDAEDVRAASVDGNGDGGGPSANTVIGCVVTDATLTKAEAVRVADLAHGGIARAVRPAHTRADGDALFCLATGRAEADPGTGVLVDLVAHLAVEAVAEASRRGPLAARGAHGLPGLADA